MTPISVFMSNLGSLGIRVWADNGRLRCSAPKGVITPELRTELSARKDEILTILRKADGSGRGQPSAGAAGPPIRRVARDRKIPLSFAQQRLWVVDRMTPGVPLYNICSALRLAGKLDVGALQRSLDEIVRRHETLRTTFALVDGEPIQVVAPPHELGLQVVDVVGTS